VETGFIEADDGFDLHFAGRLVLSHRPDRPALAMARGDATVEMVRGNFRIEDAPTGTMAPAGFELAGDTVTLSDADGPAARLTLTGGQLSAELLRGGYDRLHLHFHAEPGEDRLGRRRADELSGAQWPPPFRSGPASRASAATSRPS
jgi:sulfoquinovosidase